jgi:hypothetical protein
VTRAAGPKKFTEPVALSSTSPVNLRLPPTALGSCFGLLALRARCKSNLTRRPRPGKTPVQRKARTLRRAHCAFPRTRAEAAGPNPCVLRHSFVPVSDTSRGRAKHVPLGQGAIRFPPEHRAPQRLHAKVPGRSRWIVRHSFVRVSDTGRGSRRHARLDMHCPWGEAGEKVVDIERGRLRPARRYSTSAD